MTGVQRVPSLTPSNPDMPPTPVSHEQRIKELEDALKQAAKQLKESEQKAEFFKAVVEGAGQGVRGVAGKKPSGASSRKKP